MLLKEKLKERKRKLLLRGKGKLNKVNNGRKIEMIELLVSLYEQ